MRVNQEWAPGGLSLKGWQIVAGGRSVAQTTGQQLKIVSHPERVSEKCWYPSGVRTTGTLLSGGLRCAATTGYYLTALQAENPMTAFSHSLCSDRVRLVEGYATKNHNSFVQSLPSRYPDA